MVVGACGHRAESMKSVNHRFLEIGFVGVGEIKAAEGRRGPGDSRKGERV